MKAARTTSAHTKAVQALLSAYQSYSNFTPLEVMTKTEACIFNSVIFTIFALSFYWSVFVLPKWLVVVSERMYFYLTGQTISISLMVSLVMSKVLKNNGSGLTTFTSHSNVSHGSR